MSAVYRGIIRVADKFVPAGLQSTWNHPAGWILTSNLTMNETNFDILKDISDILKFGYTCTNGVNFFGVNI